MFLPSDGMVYTRAVIIVRVALYGALHRMLKGAYNSGMFEPLVIRELLLSSFAN